MNHSRKDFIYLQWKTVYKLINSAKYLVVVLIRACICQSWSPHSPPPPVISALGPSCASVSASWAPGGQRSSGNVNCGSTDIIHYTLYIIHYVHPTSYTGGTLCSTGAPCAPPPLPELDPFISTWCKGSAASSSLTSASKSSIRRFVITEKAPTRAFSWLKAATTAFTFKTLLRHYAKRAFTPR